MGLIIGTILAIVEAITVTEVIIAVALVVLWDPIVVPILKAIAGIFGIHDHDIVKTNVMSQRIINDNTLNKFQTRLALRHQKQPDSTIISKLQDVTGSARGRVQSAYYKAGHHTAAGLPVTNIRARNINETALIAAISNTVANPVILDYKLDVPTKTEYIHYKFQGLYGYNNLANTLMYNGILHYLTDITYNYGTNNYDCTVTQYEDVTESTTTTTTVTVTALNSTTDTVRTVVTQRVISTGNTTGTIISDVTTVQSDTSTTAATGTVTPTTTTSVATTNTVVNGHTISTSIISQVAHNTVTYVIARYYTTNVNDYSYWLYDISTGVYPNVDNSKNNKTAKDLLPVITIRNNLVNTEDLSKTSTLRKDTEELLSVLGLNLHDLTAEVKKNPNIGSIDDAFVHFGVSPADQDPIVSRVLYETFYGIYADDALRSSTDGFMATYESGPMKLGMGWKTQTLTVAAGTIGPIGTYAHSINGKDLTLQYQDTVFSYTTLVIGNLNNVSFISRGSLQGTTNNALNDPAFNIPVSFSLVQKLSSIEQTVFIAKALRITFYALVVQHIKWYQTGIFATFLQIISIVIIIVGLLTGQLELISLVHMLLIAAATGIALHLIIKYVHSPWLRAVLTVVVVLIAADVGGMFQNGLISVQSVSSIVTAFGTGMSTYAQAGMEILNKKTDKFHTLAEKRQAEIDSAKKKLNQGLGVQDIEQLNTYDPIRQYITSTVDYMMYVARDIQYDFDLAYNYDIIAKDYYDNKLRVALT